MDPVVTRLIHPSTASVSIKMSPLFTSWVTVRLPLTVTVPSSLMPSESAVLPPVKVRFPSIVDAPMINFVVPPSIVTSAAYTPSAPSVLSLVVINSAPVNPLLVFVKLTVAASAEVCNVVVPAMLNRLSVAKSWVMLPTVAVAS